ncbi:MAG: DUF503 domain-containing protein [Planctomycetes bacterium]|nr:DUF503 domain-containing protein [Planctomycetota bacterium]
MIVGSLKARLLIRGSQSLKDKRQVVRSILDRLRNQFNVSAAEVEARDHRQLVVLGFAMVGEEARDVREVLEKVVSALRCHPVAEFLDHELEA